MSVADVHNLVDRLQEMLSDESSASLAPMLRLAARIAHLTDNLEYALLFEFHLDGMDLSKASGARLTTWPDPLRRPRWDLIKAFLDDRQWSDDHAQGEPVERLEAIVREARAALRDLGFNKDLKTTEMQLSLVLSRIRNRVGVFANAMEKSRPANPSPGLPIATPKSVFVGHGRSLVWLELKDFLEHRLSLSVAEFAREATAGLSTTERLIQMLDESNFAFLVFTAEDRAEDGSMHARENVIHEAGLFQGRLGFRKAIVLLEEGCQEFSNIHGLGQIRFPKGDLRKVAEDIRRVLEREGILPS